MSKPAILLAFANDRTSKRNYLFELDKEMDTLASVFTGKMEDLILPRATLPRIADKFAKHDGIIRIFHFSGHADGQSIHLEADSDGNTKGYAKGVAEFLAQKKTIRLVFLNGCSTKEQVGYFSGDGEIPLVIYTTRPVRDDLAARFSHEFYLRFCDGSTVDEAFDHAHAQILAAFGGPERMYREDATERGSFLRDGRPKELPYELRKKMQRFGEMRLRDWLEKEETPPPAPIHPKKWLLVDRREQNNDFRDELARQLRAANGQPLFCFIAGNESEKPGYLSERFYEFTIHEEFKSRNKVLNPDLCRPILIEFPSAADFKKNKHQHRLEQVFINSEDLGAFPWIDEKWTGQNLLEVWQKRGLQVVVIEHSVRPNEWHDAIPGFIQWYHSDFWKVTPAPGSPQVVVLFRLVLPERTFFPTKHPMERQLASAPGLVLETLKPVPMDDIYAWFDLHLKHRQEAITRLPKGKNAHPMVVVAQVLKDAIESLQK